MIMANVNNDKEVNSLDYIVLMNIILGNEVEINPTSTAELPPLPTLEPTPTQAPIPPIPTPEPTATSPSEIKVKGLRIEQKRVYLKFGDSIQLNAIISPSNATNKKIKWTSSNSNLVNVDANGKVKSATKNLRLGDSMITAETEDGSYKAQVRVTITSVKVSITGAKFTIEDKNSQIKYDGSSSFDIEKEYDSCKKEAADKYKKLSIVKDGSKSNRTGTKIHFINVGRGDATLLEHNGHFGLIDTGTDDANANTYIGKILKSSKLDFVMITHWHSDHMGDIYDILSNYVNNNTKFYFIKNANLVPDSSSSEKSYHKFYCNTLVGMKNVINNNNLIYLTNKKDYTITLGDDSFKIYVLGNTGGYYPDESTNGKLNDENRNSIGALITYNDKDVLITGDMGEGDEYRVAAKISELRKYNKQVEVYKMGHHGSTSAAYTPLIDYIEPVNTVISTSVSNIRPYGNINLSGMCYMQYQYNSNLYLTGNASGAVVYNFKDNKFYNGDTTTSMTANISPLNLCTKGEKNGIKNIKFDTNDNNYKDKTCKLYLEYGNFIVGTREGISFEQEGASAKDSYRASGRVCK